MTLLSSVLLVPALVALALSRPASADPPSPTLPAAPITAVTAETVQRDALSSRHSFRLCRAFATPSAPGSRGHPVTRPPSRGPCAPCRASACPPSAPSP